MSTFPPVSRTYAVLLYQNSTVDAENDPNTVVPPPVQPIDAPIPISDRSAVEDASTRSCPSFVSAANPASAPFPASLLYARTR